MNQNLTFRTDSGTEIIRTRKKRLFFLSLILVFAQSFFKQSKTIPENPRDLFTIGRRKSSSSSSSCIIKRTFGFGGGKTKERRVERILHSRDATADFCCEKHPRSWRHSHHHCPSFNPHFFRLSFFHFFLDKNELSFNFFFLFYLLYITHMDSPCDLLRSTHKTAKIRKLFKKK